ncbi:hypothetical protein GQS_06810 [Thermococcus sp. 4557]|uniref:sulfatase-like hydrolase/transferase n=1 Tax=Thermococcus sp. (strain CGMCC 1.5172 / 4557) TaxID=1042877 RepID=UPI000219E9A9|nr:sulfatase-like hydrolase/transferase [Thermococcus sp. 4557]AEK73260.1 hypothetical protein GQS_06810 [Thermococcus sp. 4557]
MDNPHVIFVVLDTLRKDYGRLVEESLSKLGFIVYENAVAPAPWTLPSHASIFSGLYPAVHGAHETREVKNYGVRFRGPNSLLRVFDELGYSTHLISANMFVRPGFGFSGFDGFLDVYSNRTFSPFDKREKALLSRYWSEAGGSRLSFVRKLAASGEYKLLLKFFPGIALQRAHAWYKRRFQNWPIEKGSRKVVALVGRMDFSDPTFLFINLMEVHQPLFLNRHVSFYLNFRGDGPDRGLIELWRKRYGEATGYLNSRLLELMAVLKRKGIFDESLIIVLSDHGELIGEHGKVLHGTFLYDELLRVPLMVKYPESWEVEPDGDGGYISLAAMPRFISSLLSGETTDSSLYSPAVFAESYGVSNSFDLSVLSDDELEVYRFFDRYRVAVYRGHLKGIFNVQDWKFDEIVSYDSRMEVTENDVKLLKREVVRFLSETSLTRLRGSGRGVS